MVTEVRRKANKKYADTHREEIKARRAAYRKTDACKKSRKKHYLKHKEEIMAYQKEHSASEERKKVIEKYNKSEKSKERLKRYLKTEKFKNTMKKYRQTEKYKAYLEKQKNDPKVQAREKELRSIRKKKRRENPSYRLNSNFSKLVWESLRNSKEGKRWEIIVGYTVEQLKEHLEKKFEHGMAWENYGKWHVDHIIPVSVFNFSKYSHIDFKRCWALKNLQPMWANENIKKNNKLKKPFQPSLEIEAVNEK